MSLAIFLRAGLSNALTCRSMPLLDNQLGISADV
jgi:hypothetical protein